MYTKMICLQIDLLCDNHSDVSGLVNGVKRSYPQGNKINMFLSKKIRAECVCVCVCTRECVLLTEVII